MSAHVGSRVSRKDSWVAKIDRFGSGKVLVVKNEKICFFSEGKSSCDFGGEIYQVGLGVFHLLQECLACGMLESAEEGKIRASTED